MIKQEIHVFESDIPQKGEEQYLLATEKGDKLLYKYCKRSFATGFLLKDTRGQIYASMTTEGALERFEGYPQIQNLILEWSNYRLWSENDKFITGRNIENNLDIICKKETGEVIYCKYSQRDVTYEAKWRISKVINERGLNCWIKRANDKYYLCRGTYRLKHHFYNLDDLIHALKHITQEQIDNLEVYF